MGETGKIPIPVKVIIGFIIIGVVIFLLSKILNPICLDCQPNAINNIDNRINSQFQIMLSGGVQKIAIYPTSMSIVIKRGSNPSGFAFAVKNNDTNVGNFSYLVSAIDVSKCGTSFTLNDANDIVLYKSGNFFINPSDNISTPRMVEFDVPSSTAPCTIKYQIQVYKESESYTDEYIFVTIST